MHERWQHEWRPTDAAGMLWLFVAAILLGWLAYIVLGHPVVLIPE